MLTIYLRFKIESILPHGSCDLFYLVARYMLNKERKMVRNRPGE